MKDELPLTAIEQALQARYRQLLHAMQAGVKFRLGAEGTNDASSCGPKHLRVGVNAAMSDHGALVALLVRKGIISRQEYFEALVEFMEREVTSYERICSELAGRPVTLHG